MREQPIYYNSTYNISDNEIKSHLEIDLEKIQYLNKCMELIQNIPIVELRKLFKLSTIRYDTLTERNCGTTYTITIKI